MSLADNSKVNIQFVLSNKVVSACGNIGCTILELAQASGINMEGICGGSCSCTTCHVLFEKNMYKQLGEPSDEEVDMLELSTYIGNRMEFALESYDYESPDLGNSEKECGGNHASENERPREKTHDDFKVQKQRGKESEEERIQVVLLSSSSFVAEKCENENKCESSNEKLDTDFGFKFDVIRDHEEVNKWNIDEFNFNSAPEERNRQKKGENEDINVHSTNNNISDHEREKTHDDFKVQKQRGKESEEERIQVVLLSSSSFVAEKCENENKCESSNEKLDTDFGFEFDVIRDHEEVNKWNIDEFNFNSAPEERNRQKKGENEDINVHSTNNNISDHEVTEHDTFFNYNPMDIIKKKVDKRDKVTKDACSALVNVYQEEMSIIEEKSFNVDTGVNYEYLYESDGSVKTDIIEESNDEESRENSALQPEFCSEQDGSYRYEYEQINDVAVDTFISELEPSLDLKEHPIQLSSDESELDVRISKLLNTKEVGTVANKYAQGHSANFLGKRSASDFGSYGSTTETRNTYNAVLPTSTMKAYSKYKFSGYESTDSSGNDDGIKPKHASGYSSGENEYFRKSPMRQKDNIRSETSEFADENDRVFDYEEDYINSLYDYNDFQDDLIPSGAGEIRYSPQKDVKTSRIGSERELILVSSSSRIGYSSQDSNPDPYKSNSKGTPQKMTMRTFSLPTHNEFEELKKKIEEISESINDVINVNTKEKQSEGIATRTVDTKRVKQTEKERARVIGRINGRDNLKSILLRNIVVEFGLNVMEIFEKGSSGSKNKHGKKRAKVGKSVENLDDFGRKNGKTGENSLQVSGDSEAGVEGEGQSEQHLIFNELRDAGIGYAIKCGGEGYNIISWKRNHEITYDMEQDIFIPNEKPYVEQVDRVLAIYNCETFSQLANKYDKDARQLINHFKTQMTIAGSKQAYVVVYDYNGYKKRYRSSAARRFARSVKEITEKNININISSSGNSFRKNSKNNSSNDDMFTNPESAMQQSLPAPKNVVRDKNGLPPFPVHLSSRNNSTITDNASFTRVDCAFEDNNSDNDSNGSGMYSSNYNGSSDSYYGYTSGGGSDGDSCGNGVTNALEGIDGETQKASGVCDSENRVLDYTTFGNTHNSEKRNKKRKPSGAPKVRKAKEPANTESQNLLSPAEIQELVFDLEMEADMGVDYGVGAFKVYFITDIANTAEMSRLLISFTKNIAYLPIHTKTDNSTTENNGDVKEINNVIKAVLSKAVQTRRKKKNMCLNSDINTSDGDDYGNTGLRTNSVNDRSVLLTRLYMDLLESIPYVNQDISNTIVRHYPTIQALYQGWYDIMNSARIPSNSIDTTAKSSQNMSDKHSNVDGSYVELLKFHLVNYRATDTPDTSIVLPQILPERRNGSDSRYVVNKCMSMLKDLKVTTKKGTSGGSGGNNGRREKCIGLVISSKVFVVFNCKYKYKIL
ncbi:Adrenodoxin-like protein [Zancudomyces culisetae]|uniref:Adrenodoxin-like protein n=1 Tax=Zancudomyces culisetae TaxID=1213189 RepID=A0A1R1PT72_ZANCU|nr:Adrenodoxin-like protein [Zancudomyces culisetae]|eukprot:OMH84103.1 Adrenodoxin-like protein [Zancudomyces culisetae]